MTMLVGILIAGLLVKAHDPLVWIGFAGGLALGGSRQAWWLAVLLAIGITLFEALVLLDWAQEPDNISDEWPPHGTSFAVGVFFVVNSVICAIGWGIGRAAGPMVRRAISTRS